MPTTSLSDHPNPSTVPSHDVRDEHSIASQLPSPKDSDHPSPGPAELEAGEVGEEDLSSESLYWGPRSQSYKQPDSDSELATLIAPYPSSSSCSEDNRQSLIDDARELRSELAKANDTTKTLVANQSLLIDYLVRRDSRFSEKPAPTNPYICPDHTGANRRGRRSKHKKEQAPVSLRASAIGPDLPAIVATHQTTHGTTSKVATDPNKRSI